MRAGMVVVAFQLADIEEGWGGFGVVPASHNANFPLPDAVRLASTKAVEPPMLSPAMKAGDALLFMEACCHATLPWFGPKDGVGRRSALYRFCPRHMAVRSGRGHAWGGSWTYDVHQPGWVAAAPPELRAVLGPASASWASTPPPPPAGTTIENSAVKPVQPAAEAASASASAVKPASAAASDSAIKPAPAAAAAAAVATAGVPALTAAEVDLFNEQGYLICDGLVTAAHAAALMRDMDELVAQLAETRGFDTHAGTALANSAEIAETQTLGSLPSFPAVVERVRCLMEARAAAGASEGDRRGTGLFSFHHQHGSRMDAGVGPRDWCPPTYSSFFIVTTRLPPSRPGTPDSAPSRD